MASPVASKTPYYLLLVLTFVFWSNSFTAIEYALRFLGPTELLAARFLPVGIFCTAYSLFHLKETKALFKDVGWKVPAMGLLSVVGYNFFLFTGETHVPAGTAAILVATNPIQTYLLAMLFLKERGTWARTLGILIAFGGLVVVVLFGSTHEVSLPYIGYALITLLAPLCWVFYTLIGKTLLHKHRPLLVTYVTLAIGSVPTYFLLGGDFFSHAKALPMTAHFAILYLSVFCTLFCFFAWCYALRHLSATETSSFVYLNPPMAVLSAAFFLGYPLKVGLLGGLVLVLFGIYLSTREVKKGEG